MNDNSNSSHHGLMPHPRLYQSTGAEDTAGSLQDETIDILPYWNRIRRNLLLIIGVAALVSLGTYGVLAKRTPVYQATATLLIEPQHRKMVSFKEPDEAEAPDDTYYPTEIERLKFKSLARRVIDELHLAQYPEFGGQLDGSGSLAQDTAQQADSNGGASQQNSKVPEGEEQPSADMATQLSTDDLIGLFLSRLSVSAIRNTMLVRVSFEANDPHLAMQVANTICDLYAQSKADLQKTGAEQALAWFSKRVDQAREDLNAAEERLHRFLKDKNLVDASGVLSLTTSQLGEMNSRYIEARRARLEAENLYGQVANLGDRLPAELETIPAFSSHERVRDLKKQLDDTLTRVDALSKRYGPQHPERVLLETQLDSLRTALKKQLVHVSKELKSKLDVARANENALALQSQTLKKDIHDLSNEDSEYKKLQYDVKAHRDLYELFSRRLKETLESEDLQPSNLSIPVKDPALLPMFPIRPNKTRGAELAFLLALLACVGLACLAEYLDKSIKCPQDVQRKLGLPLLGKIPFIKTPSSAPLTPASLMDPLCAFSESIRTLCAGTLIAKLNYQQKSFLVTSSRSNEGKSTVSLGLAITMAQLEQKVLLIEANMRSPNLTRLCGLPEDALGISDMIFRTHSYKECRHSLSDGRITLIPIGTQTANPFQVCASPLFAEILTLVQLEYDVVIIDSPPMESVSDTRLLAPFVSGVIYVVKAYSTPVPTVLDGIELLSHTRTPVTGVILNQV